MVTEAGCSALPSSWGLAQQHRTQIAKTAKINYTAMLPTSVAQDAAAADQQPDLDHELETELASFALLANASVSTEIPGQLDFTELTAALPDDHSKDIR